MIARRHHGLMLVGRRSIASLIRVRAAAISNTNTGIGAIRNSHSAASTTDATQTSITSAAGTTTGEEKNGPLFVFLEGQASVGKGVILQRINKMGYQTHNLGYVDFCLRPENLQYSPSGALMQLKWAESHIRQIEQYHEQYKADPNSFKGGFAFIFRSLITPAVMYATTNPIITSSSPFLEAMQEIKQRFRTQTVLCVADKWRIQIKMHHRYEQGSTEEQRRMRDALRELSEDHQNLILERYMQLATGEHPSSIDDAAAISNYNIHRPSPSSTWFDHIINTTDPKQATAKLLEVLGVKFELPPQPLWSSLSPAPPPPPPGSD